MPGRSLRCSFVSLKYVAQQKGTRKQVQAEREEQAVHKCLALATSFYGEKIYLKTRVEIKLAEWHLTATRKKELQVKSGLQTPLGGLFPFKNFSALPIDSGARTVMAFLYNSSCH